MIERFTDFSRDPVTVARRLLGQRLVRIDAEGRRAGTIVEVEAYRGVRDRAAHAFGGRRTARNASMYLAGGHAYVYRIYGLHWCFNVVCGNEDEPVAVLVRAIEPTEGVARQRAARPKARRPTDVASGPGRLCAALGIDRAHDGIDLALSPDLFVERVRRRALPRRAIAVGPRVGVEYAGEWARAPLRFAVAGHPHVSRTPAGLQLEAPPAGLRSRRAVGTDIMNHTLGSSAR